MASALRATALSIIAVLLGACGSGGGGGGTTVAPTPPPTPSGGNPPPAAENPAPAAQNPAGNPPPAGGNSQQTTPRVDVPFTSFSTVQGNQNVIMSGSATTISGTQLFVGPNEAFPSFEVRFQRPNASVSGAATLALGFDGQGSLATLAINGAEGSVSFDRSAGHDISCSGGTCTASHGNATAVIQDPSAMGWNYQTFGVWAMQSRPITKPGETSTYVLGAASAGNPTPGNAIPTLGRATFDGRAAGHLYDQPIRHTTAADMKADVSFQNRTIDFTTSNTTVTNPNNGVQGSNPQLDLRGSFSWATGVNNFSGTVQTRDNQLSGRGSGSFYGPGAQEIGGTYDLGSASGPGLRMIGGFGGKQRP